MLKLLIIAAVALTTFAASFNSNTDNLVNEESEIGGDTKTIAVSLDNFTAYYKLGYGATSSAYLVKKNAGPDDGKLYAMKIMNIAHVMLFTGSENSLIRERKILEAVRADIPFATGLQYSFREGNWLFYVIDLGIGGSLNSTLGNLDAITTKRIITEIVVAVEKLHKVNILHNDLSNNNFVIDSDGHLLVTDFGLSKELSDNESSHFDWNRLAAMCYYIFPYPIRDESQFNLMKFLETMTDSQLPELKKLKYFEGIDWDSVARRESMPPFEPIDFEIDVEHPMDLIDCFHIQINQQLQTSLGEPSYNYTFVAEHH